jgi:hypothetical protein
LAADHDIDAADGVDDDDDDDDGYHYDEVVEVRQRL